MNWIIVVKGILTGICVFTSLILFNKYRNQAGNTLIETTVLSVLIPFIIFL
jgi:hypothetical protein